MWILADLDFTETCEPGVIVQQAIREGPALAQNQLQHFSGLDRSDHTGQCTDDAGFLATRDHAGRRRLFEHATIAGALSGKDREHTAVKPEDATVHQWFFCKEAG